MDSSTRKNKTNAHIHKIYTSILYKWKETPRLLRQLVPLCLLTNDAILVIHSNTYINFLPILVTLQVWFQLGIN